MKYYSPPRRILTAVEDKNNATVLTYIGYATRKLGKADERIAWYHRALAVDPDNVYTREFLGEGQRRRGRMDVAKQERAKLERLCGKGCEQYDALSAATPASRKAGETREAAGKAVSGQGPGYTLDVRGASRPRT